MEDLYFVVKDGRGVTYFNNESGSMTSIRTSENKDEWERYTLSEAIEIRRHTNYEILEV